MSDDAPDNTPQLNSEGTAGNSEKRAVRGRPFSPGDARINRTGRPPTPEGIRARMRQVQERALDLIEARMESPTVKLEQLEGIVVLMGDRSGNPTDAKRASIEAVVVGALKELVNLDVLTQEQRTKAMEHFQERQLRMLPEKESEE